MAGAGANSISARCRAAARRRAETEVRIEPAVDRYEAVYRRVLATGLSSSSTR